MTEVSAANVDPGRDPALDVPPTSPAAYAVAFWILRRLFDDWIDAEVLGREHLPPSGTASIVTINHSSALDYLGGHAVGRPGYYAIKREAADYPLTGRLVRATGGIPIKRDQQDNEALRAMRAVLRAGHVLGIAPEGTRSRDGTLGPFDPGFAWLAARTGTVVVPLAIHGTHRLLPRGRLIPRRGRIWAKFGAPMPPPAGRPSRETLAAFADAVRERMLDLLAELAEMSGVPSPAVDAARPAASHQNDAPSNPA